MSQEIWTSINPLTTSGLMLAGILTDFKDALMSGCAGSTRPANLQAGGMWVNTANQSAPNYYWAFVMYDGVNDVEVFRISILNDFGGTLTADATFEIQRFSADAVGPILELIKNRIANNGQVLTGDVVAELKFTGRTNTSTDPVAAILRFTSTDNMTTATSGGTFAMYSTPDGSSAITEHLRFINSQVETFAAHKLNSVQPVSQDVATAASIAQLSATKMRVEMTGATATEIHGINSAHDSKIITIHNRSTAEVKLKHSSGTAAAADRMQFSSGIDVSIIPDGSASLYYCTTDARWKLLAATSKKIETAIESFSGIFSQWTAPVGVSSVRLVGYKLKPLPDGVLTGISSNNHFMHMLDPYGVLYAWGLNANGQLGVGDVVPRSSPVAVLGGLRFTKAQIGLGLAINGSAYSWGINTNGQLGLGDVVPRSSPVAVLGGLKFVEYMTNDNCRFGLTEDGTAYAWGLNSNGQLGVGDVTPRSSPVAVLGGLKFTKLFMSPQNAAGAGGSGQIFGITRAGDLYAWGNNETGQLGVGDTTSRSSPVAVVGGLKWKKVVISGSTNQTSILGLTQDGNAYGWGSNLFGILGVGDSVPRSSPVAVVGGLTFTDIQQTEQIASSFGLTENGALYSWGRDSQAQLGHGTYLVNCSSPVAVIGGFFYSHFNASQQHVLAIEKDTGTIYAWGLNGDGQGGQGNITTRFSSPMLVLGGIKAEDVFAIANQSYAISLDGRMYSWGENTNGKLGVGDVGGRSSPVAVLGGHGSELYFRKPEVDLVLDVVSGNVYDISLGNVACSFGNKVIGYGLEKITIEYLS